MKRKAEFKKFKIEKPQWRVSVLGEDPNTIVISLVTRPNIWIRFWMWAFFGWRFKPI